MRKMLEVGEKVDYHSIIGGPIDSKNHTILSFGELGHGEVVAWITDHRGAVCLQALTRVEEV